MTSDASPGPIRLVQSRPVIRGVGVTPTERLLHQLCERSFLSPWSYPHVFHAEGNARGDGKELCDSLVVFGQFVLIFSDRNCAFPNTGDVGTDWARWFRKSVASSARQVLGAERWILGYPDRIYLDPACTRPFPLAIPAAKDARVHRIVVARGSRERCAAEGYGSGAIRVRSALRGENAHATTRQSCRADALFAVGDLAPTKGFVHVFDDVSLDIVLRHLDTLMDLVGYLRWKEALLRSNDVEADGEEDLLAFYDQNQLSVARLTPKPVTAGKPIVVNSGSWAALAASPEFAAATLLKKDSYVWDLLVEQLGRDWRVGRFYFTGGEPSPDWPAFTLLAAEPRDRRQLLAGKLLALTRQTRYRPEGAFMAPASALWPHYVFLVYPQGVNQSEGDYRKARHEMLVDLCCVAKDMRPYVKEFTGIAVRPDWLTSGHSKHLFYYSESLSAEDRAKAKRLRDAGIFRHESEPAATMSPTGGPSITDILHHAATTGRNDSCFCGSGKKYKKCCLRYVETHQHLA